MNAASFLLDGIRSVVYRPYGLKRFGRDSRVRLPRRIRGSECISVGDNVTIDSHAWIEGVRAYRDQRFSPRIVLGDNVTIGRHATITAISHVDIGRGCLFSEGVYISDHGHDVFSQEDVPLVERPLKWGGDVSIGDHCFLGFRACVLPGVVLGSRCVVGANAVVTRSFAAGSVVAGSPARLLRTIGGA